MEWLIFVAIVAVVWWVVSSRKNSIGGNALGEHYDSDRPISSGQVSEIEKGVFAINPMSPYPLHFIRCSLEDAWNLRDLLDGAVQWERNIGDITYLIAQKNIECVELEEFVAKVRVEVEANVEKQKQASPEWIESSELDKVDLLREYQVKALEQLATKPADDYVLETLLFGEPGDVTADDDLISLFSGDNKLYRFYVSNLGRTTNAVKVMAGDYYRKSWESLVELGLAKRGKDIPIEALFSGFRMKDINEYFSDRLEKKLTRKIQAIEFAARQPDALKVLSKHISFREMFQICEPEGSDVSDIKACYQYANAQAELIHTTFVSGYHTLATLQEAKDADYDGWEIEGGECCQVCEKLHKKRTKRKPAKLPPFHIGCNCSLEGIYDI